MAINIKKVTGYLLDKNPLMHGKDLWFDNYSKYIRLTISGTPTWYYVTDKGFIVDKVAVYDELEKLYEESNGFLEQLELF